MNATPISNQENDEFWVIYKERRWKISFQREVVWEKNEFYVYVFSKNWVEF